MTRLLTLLLVALLLCAPAHAAISVVGSIETGSIGNDTTVTCSTPTGTTTDDIMYMWWTKDDDPVPTGDPADTGGTWATLESNGTTTGDHRGSGVYRMIVTGTPASTYTVTGDKEAWVCMIVTLRGVNTTTPEDVTQTYNPEENTSTPTATGLTPANNASGPNIWVFSGCDVAATTFTVPSTYTEGATLPSTGIDTSLGYKTNAWKSVEGDAAFALGIADDCQSYMLAVRDASPPTPPAGRTRRTF